MNVCDLLWIGSTTRYFFNFFTHLIFNDKFVKYGNTDIKNCLFPAFSHFHIHIPTGNIFLEHLGTLLQLLLPFLLLIIALLLQQFLLLQVLIPLSPRDHRVDGFLLFRHLSVGA